MLGLTFLVVSIGLADSLNPTTVGPALYLATTHRARAGLLSFTIGVFAVYLLGGVFLTLGPGQLILSAIPHPDRHAKHLIELVAGGIALGLAGGLWLGRERVQSKVPDTRRSAPGPAFVLGAGITALELPTAFPYFAAIAAIVGSDVDIPEQVFLVVLFNVLFVLPLLVILAVREFAGARAEDILRRFGQWVQDNGAALLAALLAVVGVVAIAIGSVGLTG